MCAFRDRSEPHAVPLGTHPLWDEALAAVNRDLAATLPDQRLLHLVTYARPEPGAEDGEPVYVLLPGGARSFLMPAESAATALTTLADAAQDTVAERLWQAWPVCTLHDLGMHPRVVDGRPSWWCAGGSRTGDPAHVRAAIGELDTVHRPRRPNRKRRRGRPPR